MPWPWRQWQHNMAQHEISIRENTKSVALDRYAGEWVAFIDGKVIAHQGSLWKLMEETKRLLGSSRKPSVLLVPKIDDGPYVG